MYAILQVVIVVAIVALIVAVVVASTYVVSETRDILVEARKRVKRIDDDFFTKMLEDFRAAPMTLCSKNRF